MPETIETTPEVTPEITPEPTPTPEPTSSYFGGDGTLNEGWQSTLDEGYRDEKSLATVKDAKVLAKMFVDTKRMVGKDTIAIPSDTSTEGEWNEYHRAGGRPETVADYALKIPEGFPQEIVEQAFPADRITKWQERFFKGGVSKKAADSFVAEFAQDILVDYQNIQVAKEQQMTELTKGLSADWGNAYDQNIHLGNMAIEEGTGGDGEFKARVVAKIQNDPDLTRFASNLGSKFSEGKPPSYTAIPTPSDMQTKIDELTNNPLYLNGTQAQRMKIADQIMLLRKKMKPEPATT